MGGKDEGGGMKDEAGNCSGDIGEAALDTAEVPDSDHQQHGGEDYAADQKLPLPGGANQGAAPAADDAGVGVQGQQRLPFADDADREGHAAEPEAELADER